MEEQRESLKDPQTCTGQALCGVERLQPQPVVEVAQNIGCENKEDEGPVVCPAEGSEGKEAFQEAVSREIESSTCSKEEESQTEGTSKEAC